MTMVSTDDAATAATPEFVPLSKHIGCEVKGIDLRKPLLHNFQLRAQFRFAEPGVV